MGTLQASLHAHAWGLEPISDSPAVASGTPHTRAPGRHWSRVSAPLAGKNERNLFPNLAVCGRGVEFDHLPRLRLHLDAVGERIHRHHGGRGRPSHRFRGAAGTGSLLLSRLDVDQRLCGDVHLDDLAILVCDAPGLCCAFDMDHGGAQRLPKDAGRDEHGDGEYDPEQAQRAWTRLAMHSVSPLCEPDPPMSTPRSQGRYQGAEGKESPWHRAWSQPKSPVSRANYLFFIGLAELSILNTRYVPAAIGGGNTHFS